MRKTKIYKIEIYQQDKGWQMFFEPIYGNRFTLCFSTVKQLLKFLTNKLVNK